MQTLWLLKHFFRGWCALINGPEIQANNRKKNGLVLATWLPLGFCPLSQSQWQLRGEGRGRDIHQPPTTHHPPPPGDVAISISIFQLALHRQRAINGNVSHYSTWLRDLNAMAPLPFCGVLPPFWVCHAPAYAHARPDPLQ